MLERNQSFELQDKNFNDVQKVMENVLENNFSFLTVSKRLGRSLLRINYYDNKFEKEQQKDNRITILQEQGKRVYIQINGKLMDSQIERLWNELEKKFNNSISKLKLVKELSSKEETIQEIMDLIDNRGYIIKKEEVQTFIDNFLEEYNRLPKKDEFNSIVKGYIIIANEVKNKNVIEANLLNNESIIGLAETSQESDHISKRQGNRVNRIHPC